MNSSVIHIIFPSWLEWIFSQSISRSFRMRDKTARSVTFFESIWVPSRAQRRQWWEFIAWEHFSTTATYIRCSVSKEMGPNFAVSEFTIALQIIKQNTKWDSSQLWCEAAKRLLTFSARSPAERWSRAKIEFRFSSKGSGGGRSEETHFYHLMWFSMN